jgi:hypothetical protein
MGDRVKNTGETVKAGFLDVDFSSVKPSVGPV